MLSVHTMANRDFADSTMAASLAEIMLKFESPRFRAQMEQEQWKRPILYK
jgi:hypothetical protein